MHRKLGIISVHFWTSFRRRILKDWQNSWASWTLCDMNDDNKKNKENMLIKREGKVWYHILISSKSSPSQTPLGSAIYVMKDKLVWCVLSSRRYQQPPTTNTHAATFVFTGRQPDINPLHQIKTRTTKSAERDDLYTSFDKEIRLRLPSPCPSPPRAPSALHTRAQFHFFNAFHYSPPPAPRPSPTPPSQSRN